ncbi:MAG: FKBP-type peptidyl-prolyl cis-trans isomerase [Polyangiaceae bacterium]
MTSVRFVALSSVLLSLCFGCNRREPEPAVEPAKAEPPPSAAPAAPPPPPPPEQVMTPAPPPAPPSIPAPDDVATPPKDAKKTASGLTYKVLKPSTNKQHPGDQDKAKVHYTGWTKDGKMFDSSVQRGEPATFGVTQVIKGWTEALKLMTVGEKRRLWIPARLAYGEKAPPGAPVGDLTFDVELLEILAAPKAPEDVKAPPKTAKKTDSGLAYRVLKPGTGKVHPQATDKVSVHYTGWTTDGNMFDSSLTGGAPISFPLNGVIKGWTEGVQLMVEGEKTRFWIPGNLAYGDKPMRPGAPAGMLVFDIELLKIQ